MPEDGRRPLYWAMSVADDLRAESRAAGRLIGPPESIELAFRLGDEDVAMVFGFAYPDYPPTERR